MKMRFSFLAALALAVTLTACSDTLLAPDSANFELVDTGDRIDKDDVNARVYLSFAIPFEIEIPGGGTGAIVPTAQADGPALNFPGPAKNAGSCESGTWKNKNGSGMGGTEANPHPHCTIWIEEGGSTFETIYVVLEPISAYYEVKNANQHLLHFADRPGDNGAVKILNNAGELEGNGEIVAWAVLQDDLDQRVGKITIDLSDLTGEWDVMDCTISGDPSADGCLKTPVPFSYEPEAEEDGGIGIAGTYVEGFLWWEFVDAGTGWYRND